MHQAESDPEETLRLRERVRELESQLEVAQLRLRRLVDTLPGAAVFIEAGRIVLNPAAARLTGYETADVPTLSTWFQRLYPGRTEDVRGVYEADMRAGFPGTRRMPLIRKDGEERLVEFAGYQDESSEVWLMRDVTEEARLARLLNQTTRAAQIGGWELDIGSGHLHWTDETYRIHETTPSLYVPTTSTAIAYYVPECRAIIAAAVRRAEQSGSRFDLELELITALGKRIWVHVIGQSERQGEQPIRVYGSIQDITEAKRSQWALERSESRNRALLSALPDLLFLQDRQGTYLECHAPNPEILRVPREQLIGRTMEELLPAELAARIKSTLLQTLETRQLQLLEYEIEIHGKQHIVEARFVPCGDDQVLRIVRDVTEQRHAEQQRLRMERDLQETQRLESLGVLAGGIAHDFNNLLTAILGYADLADLELPPDSSIRAYLRHIDQASRRAAELCQQMLAYAGKGRYLLEPLDLSEVVRQTMGLMQLSISKKAVLHTELAADLPTIDGDAAQLRQVLMNLVMNGSEALGEHSGVVTIRTRPGRADGGEGQVDESSQERCRVLLEVRDTGCGIDPEIRGRIFEPFFTTKFAGRGLGLAAVQGIVRSHGGDLQLESVPGQGTTVRLSFPTAFGRPAKTYAPVAPFPFWQRQGAVLVIENEEGIRLLATHYLESLGFHVVQARDGADGVCKLREWADALRLILIDLPTPTPRGEEAFRQLRQQAANLPIILMSGQGELDVRTQYAGQHLCGFLHKPFSRDDLAVQVKRALAGGAS